MNYIFGRSKLADLFLKDLEVVSDTNLNVSVYPVVDREYHVQGFSIFDDVVDYAKLILCAEHINMYLPIGYKVPGLKREKYKKCKEARISTPSLIAEKLHGKQIRIQEASWIMPKAVVGHFSNIGIGVTLWSGCNLSHHCSIGDFSWISPQAVILGEASIGSDCFIGAGSIIGEGVTVGNGCFIGAGAILTKNLPPDSIALDGKNNIESTNNADRVKYLYGRLK